MVQSKAFAASPANAASSIQPYELHIPEEDVRRMKDLLKLSRVAGPVYENSPSHEAENLGLRRDWLLNAKDTWETDFDWQVCADKGTPWLLLTIFQASDREPHQ